MPFEIPDSWTWIRLRSFSNIYTGSSINEEEKKRKFIGQLTGFNYIGTKDINFDHTIIYENGIKIPYGFNFRVAPKHKILLCIEGGSAGRKVAILNMDVCFGNKLACINTFIINDTFLFFFMQSFYFHSIFKSSLSGIIGGVSLSTLKNFPVPLPPIEEQRRIVEKLNVIEPFLKRYEELEGQLNILDKQFSDKLKKSILQYAIEGKLVSQDGYGESILKLSQRIKNEKEQLISEGKIKREKLESVIYKSDDKNYYEKIGNKITNITDQLPFEIPDSWTWIRQNDLCWLDSGNVSEEENLPYLEAKVIRGIAQPKMVNKGVIVSEKNRVILVDGENSGEIMIPPCRGYMGSTFKILSFSKNIFNAYLLLFFMLNKPKYKNSKVGAAIPHLNKELFRNFLVPLPPIEEQRRIVEKLNVIFEHIPKEF